MAKRRPKTPLSPYDPKYKESKMTMDPRSEEYQRLKEQFIKASAYAVWEFAPDTSPRPSSPDTSAVRDWLHAPRHDVNWDSVIGNDEAKAALRLAIEDTIEHAALFAAYKMQAPKGVLLYGPPGCGKTMLAKAAATALQAEHFLIIEASSIHSMYYGETEKKIASIFSYARSYARHYKKQLLVFIDEADGLLSPRGQHELQDRIITTFLTELDGMGELGAFIILASNRPDNIDEALLRDGRIGRKIQIKRPDYNAVADIIGQALIGVPMHSSHDLLVDTATELLFSPSFVLQDLAALGFRMTAKGEVDIQRRELHFCLSDIVSGALATSLVERAKTFAFLRDRQSGRVSGIMTEDVSAAVAEIFRDNQNLHHHFALNEFCDAKKLELERK